MVNDANNAEGSKPAVPPATPSPTPPVSPQNAGAPTGAAGIPVIPSGQAENLQSDISRILADIKLPERRGKDIQPPAPRNMYDTKQPGSGVADAATAEAQVSARASEKPAVVQQNSAPQPSISELAADLGHKATDVRPMHTLKDDLQEVVKDKKISLVRAVALEEQKRSRKPVEGMAQTAPLPRRWGLAMFASLTLIALGMLALGAVFIVMQERSGGSSTAFPSSLLFAEQTIPLPIDSLAPNDIRRTLSGARQSTVLTLGAMLQILPLVTMTDPATNATALAPVPFDDFLRATGMNPPAELLRAVGDEFFLGIHTVDENAPVIVATVTSYERAFAAMLAWEKSLNSDLAPFFTSVPLSSIGPDGILIERSFEDTVMRNYDVRVLKDDTGTVQLYYSFPNRNLLIIAESPYSFTEILSRLRADRRL